MQQPALAPAPHPLGSGQYQDNVSTENRLRQQLLAEQHAPMHQHGNDLRTANSASPHDQNIDPAISGGPPMTPNQNLTPGNDSMPLDTPDSVKKGGKRELSTSKRAAQNRAAQRAFRQRKEGKIKKLEEQVRGLEALEASFKASQAENYQLRSYIISLQSRLIESGREAPPLPSNIELHRPDLNVQQNTQQTQDQRQQTPQQQAQQAQQQVPAPTAPMGSAG